MPKVRGAALELRDILDPLVFGFSFPISDFKLVFSLLAFNVIPIPASRGLEVNEEGRANDMEVRGNETLEHEEIHLYLLNISLPATIPPAGSPCRWSKAGTA